MNATEYKRYHESFMQNNHGSTAFHTFLCIFFTVQCSLLCTITRKRKCDRTQFVHEYAIIVLPMILAHTILSDYITILNIIVFMCIAHEIRKIYDLVKLTECLESKPTLERQRIVSISVLRALTYLITALCILAVDFKDFPRFLAKTENYGYSLMDTGVGLFVLMSGLVHKNINKKNYVTVLKGNTKFIVILLGLGIARFVSVKQLNYQEHVTEYGVHWNFFFTLAICKLLSSLILVVYKCTLQSIVSVFFIHEFLLYIGLQSWVFSNIQRINFLDSNREGISSSLGYVFLYLFAVLIKNGFVRSRPTYYETFRKLFTYTVMLIFCSYISNEYSPVSRTLANSAYCCYLSLLLVLILSILYVLEVLYDYNKFNFEIPLILEAINNNGLLYFLASNLATGVINMMFRTLLLSSFATFLLLNMYMIFNLTLILYLNKKGIKI